MTKSGLKIGFIGLGIMGAPMAGHLLNAGHTCCTCTRAARYRRLLPTAAPPCAPRRRVWRSGPTSSSSWCPTRPMWRRRAVRRRRRQRPESGPARKLVVDMSSISPSPPRLRSASTPWAATTSTHRCPVARWAPRPRALTIMCGGSRTVFERVRPLLELMGKNITLVAATGRRPDHQGGQPDHRGAEHRRRGRGIALCRQGRRRPGQGARGPDGRLCRQPHPGGARRTHGQAHVCAGLSASSCTRRT
jgi:hypothetical protein